MIWLRRAPAVSLAERLERLAWAERPSARTSPADASRSGAARGGTPRAGTAALSDLQTTRGRHHIAREPRDDDAGVSPDELAATAASLLRAEQAARHAGELGIATAALARCHDLASRLAARAPDRTDAPRLQAEALYRLAGIQIDRGRLGEAYASLDAAEGLYSRLGDDAPALVADVRARRARVHAALGHGLSALVDAQAAVLHHGALEPDTSAAGRLRLAGALTGAAAVQADHGGSRLALSAAQQARTLLGGTGGADQATGQPTAGTGGGGDLAEALAVEVRMLRAMGRTLEIVAPTTALGRVGGPDAVRRVLDCPPEAVRPDLVHAVDHPLVTLEAGAVAHLLVRAQDAVAVPGFLVEPGRLLDAAREGAATALMLADHDPQLALAAGRDAACLYACAEQLGFLEHPWPVVRIELARWLWLLTELGWLAGAHGDVDLARDLAHHAQHPLIRAESGSHLPSPIARSLAQSADRLEELQVTLA